MTKEGLIEITKLALLYSIEHDAKKILEKTPEPSPAFEKITITTPPATKETAVATQVPDTIIDTEPVKEIPKKNKKGYSGFLMIECEECGREHTFYSKLPLSDHTCKQCRNTYPLNHIRNAISECKCGTTIRYKTNSKSRVLSIGCIKCHAPVDLELNEHTNTYVTMKEKKKHH